MAAFPAAFFIAYGQPNPDRCPLPLPTVLLFLTAEHLEEVGWEVPFHKGIQFLDAELVSCHLLIALHDFLHHDILQPVLKGLAVLFWSNCIGSRPQEVCGDLPCFLVTEEEEPQSNSNEDFQHDTASCSAMIRRIVESANPVCSLMER